MQTDYDLLGQQSCHTEISAHTKIKSLNREINCKFGKAMDQTACKQHAPGMGGVLTKEEKWDQGAEKQKVEHIEKKAGNLTVKSLLPLTG